MKKFEIDNINDFNLSHIFDCGQCFRWERQEDGTYTGIAKNRVVNMNYIKEEKKLIIDNCDQEDFQQVWRPYLDLDRDYGEIKKTLINGDPIMEKAVDNGYGIRLLQQDLWETMISFIISQNNNIPRIKGCIEKLAEQFGEACHEIEGRTFYNIPGPEKLASLTADDLGAVRLGYRARYLIEAGKSVCENGLPSNEEQLSKICGIGPKVANCISLFGMSKYDSFPIDVWVRRLMHQLYGLDENDKKAMTEYAKEHFGKLGGFAQQYLFYYIREINK